MTNRHLSPGLRHPGNASSVANPPLEWIRVSEVARRLGSFTAAMPEPGLTQAAVSQRIRNLEDKIATPLFIRAARGVTLTIEGGAWLRFDSFVSGSAAVIAGAGVVLGSVPLCAPALAEGSLIRLSGKTLEQDAGYRMTSKEENLARKQWVELVERVCGGV